MTSPDMEIGPAGNGTDPTTQRAADSDSTVSVQAHIHGIDGKFYPRPLSREDRLGLIAVVHGLACVQGLSIRKIRAELERDGIRRSVGSISTYLSGWTCTGCSGAQSETPEHLTGGAA